MENYLIVLFKNKVRHKILKKYITYKKAKNYFDEQVRKSEEVVFDKLIVNGKECKFEVGLIEKSSKQLVPVYMTDEMGRNIKVKLENDGLTMIQIVPFKIEEEVFDIQKNVRISVPQLIRRYLSRDGIKMVSTLNNKIIIQNNDDVSLFSLKSNSEANRFIDCLSHYFFKIKRGDCIFVKDVSSAQKKYLYKILSEKGIDKKILYRKFTTFPQNSVK